MNIHKNARLTPLRREEMAQSVIAGTLSQAQATVRYAVTAKIVKRWVERYQAEGHAGMVDRPSRPHVMPGLTEQAVAERIVALRRQRWTGQHTAHDSCGRAATRQKAADFGFAAVSRQVRLMPKVVPFKLPGASPTHRVVCRPQAG